MSSCDNMKIKLIEDHPEDFTACGLDILRFIERRNQETPFTVPDFKDYGGEFYRKPAKYTIGKDIVYQKHAPVAETHAEVLLGYMSNDVGVKSAIYYPYFNRRFSFSQETHIPDLPDGSISKSVTQVDPDAILIYEDCFYTIKGLYTDERCLQSMTRKGRLSKMKNLIFSIVTNNKDEGNYDDDFSNVFWSMRKSDGKIDDIIAIDHGYSGRDSMFGRKDDVMQALYFNGEHGYNGIHSYHTSRKDVLNQLKRLLAGEKVDGVVLPNEDIRELRAFIATIAKYDIRATADMIKDKFSWKTYAPLLNSLEWCREDALDGMDDTK